MILSAGLTPAWQQILVFDAFRHGEVNRAAEAHWCTAGKVANAGIAAHSLGGPSLTLTTVGGLPGVQIRRELDTLGVPHRLIETAKSTRVCTTILERSDGTMTELVENGRPLAKNELATMLDAYTEEAALAEVAVITGSLPTGTPSDFYRQLVERTPCPAVLDFRGPGLLASLDLKPFVIKPNREELAQTVGRSLQTDTDLLNAMRTLAERGAQWVVVTEGSKPVWIVSRTETHRLDPPRVETKLNPIGCGDAMAASIAWATRDGRSLIDAVRFGMGAAAENLGQLLPCRLDPTRVEVWVESVG